MKNDRLLQHNTAYVALEKGAADLELYAHNRTAYDAMLPMLETCRRDPSHRHRKELIAFQLIEGPKRKWEFEYPLRLLYGRRLQTWPMAGLAEERKKGSGEAKQLRNDPGENSKTGKNRSRLGCCRMK